MPQKYCRKFKPAEQGARTLQTTDEGTTSTIWCRLICHEIKICVFCLVKAKTHLILKEDIISFTKIQGAIFSSHSKAPKSKMASKMASIQQQCNISANMRNIITNKVSKYRFSDRGKPLKSSSLGFNYYLHAQFQDGVQNGNRLH